MKQKSPWLYELNRTREERSLQENHACDVLIVGGGIAGLMTAFFVLTYTDKEVVLAEAGRVAHGATGHNGGQMVSYFEKSFAGLVKRYGLTLATRAQADILSAWDLLKEVQEKAQLTTPVHQFQAYSAYASMPHLLEALENRYWLKEAGLLTEQVLIASGDPRIQDIPERYKDLYSLVPKGMLLDRLETDNQEFFAASTAQRGVTNSARLTEELAGYLLKQFPKRFKLLEKTPIVSLKLQKEEAIGLNQEALEIRSKKVVLCTNGFEKIKIYNDDGPDIDTRFHHLVSGIVGYMCGYTEEPKHKATAISYHGYHENISSENGIEPYFYLTRRPFIGNRSLVTLGGPEWAVEDTTAYDKEAHVYPKQAADALNSFLVHNYIKAPKVIDYSFQWHGLMGYTPSSLRCIGPEPLNPTLMYNLGCNGTGILSSIFGAKKIADFLIHGKQEASLFDPGISGEY